MGVQGSDSILCVHWPHLGRFCALRNPWVLSCQNSVQSWVMLHKYHCAAWHGACVHRTTKKNPTPNQQNTKQTPHQPKQKNCPITPKILYGQRWPRGIPGQAFCGLSGLLFFSILAWVTRGTRVHKCDLLTHR